MKIRLFETATGLTPLGDDRTPTRPRRRRTPKGPASRPSPGGRVESWSGATAGSWPALYSAISWRPGPSPPRATAARTPTTRTSDIGHVQIWQAPSHARAPILRVSVGDRRVRVAGESGSREHLLELGAPPDPFLERFERRGLGMRVDGVGVTVHAAGKKNGKD